MKTTWARRPTPVMAATAVVIGVILDANGHEARCLLGKWQQRIALSAAETAAGVFAQEENDEGENEAEADGEGEWNDGHDVGLGGNYFFPGAAARTETRVRRGAGAELRPWRWQSSSFAASQ